MVLLLLLQIVLFLLYSFLSSCLFSYSGCVFGPILVSAPNITCHPSAKSAVTTQYVPCHKPPIPRCLGPQYRRTTNLLQGQSHTDLYCLWSTVVGRCPPRFTSLLTHVVFLNYKASRDRVLSIIVALLCYDEKK